MRAETPKDIKELHWKDATGITEQGKKGTNSMLEERNYNIECCITGDPLMIVHGVHIWFCKSHHQPLFHCEKRKTHNKTLKFTEAIILADKTNGYKYGGKDSPNTKNEIPPINTRWLYPRELARDFINYLKS